MTDGSTGRRQSYDSFLDRPISDEKPVPGLADLADLQWRREHRGDLAVLVAAVLAGLVAVVGFNALADPLGLVGPDRYRVVSRDWLERAYKLDQLDARTQAPELLVLGTSSMARLAPDAVGAADGAGVNLTLPAATPRETELLVRRVRERWPDDPHPRLVWGIDVHSVRRAPVNPSLLADDTIRDMLPLEERWRAASERWKPLFDLRRVPDGIRAIHRGRPETPGRDELLAADGTSRLTTFGDLDLGLDAPRRVGAAELPSTEAFPKLDPAQLEAIERVVERAADDGVRPVIFLPPVRPTILDAGAASPPDHGSPEYWQGWRKRRIELLEFLQRLGSRHELTVVDLSDLRPYGGSESAFVDDVHPDDESLAIVADQLVQRGALQ